MTHMEGARGAGGMKMHQKIKEKLEELNICHEQIDVFGAARLNIHVACKSRDTADNWIVALSSAFKGAKIGVVKTSWEAKHNKGTCLLPTRIEGYRVHIVY